LECFIGKSAGTVVPGNFGLLDGGRNVTVFQDTTGGIAEQAA
jgi:hypothetical protein